MISRNTRSKAFALSVRGNQPPFCGCRCGVVGGALAGASSASASLAASLAAVAAAAARAALGAPAPAPAPAAAAAAAAAAGAGGDRSPTGLFLALLATLLLNSAGPPPSPPGAAAAAADSDSFRAIGGGLSLSLPLSLPASISSWILVTRAPPMALRIRWIFFGYRVFFLHCLRSRRILPAHLPPPRPALEGRDDPLW